MRIAQVAPLAEPVPPKGYGGSERVVSWLTGELVQQGRDVTLFASADSDTKAKLIPCARRALRLAGFRDHTASLLVMLDQVRRRGLPRSMLNYSEGGVSRLEPLGSGCRIRKGEQRHDKHYHDFIACAGAEP
jgi:hypothetical protein